MGRTYRNDGVDIQKDAATAERFYVSKIEDGEWLNYTVNAEKKGTYTLNLNIASDNMTGKISLLANNLPAKKMLVPNTGGEQKWQNIKLQNIFLQKGSNNIRIYADKGGFNFKSFQFSY